MCVLRASYVGLAGAIGRKNVNAKTCKDQNIEKEKLVLYFYSLSTCVLY